MVKRLAVNAVESGAMDITIAASTVPLGYFQPRLDHPNTGNEGEEQGIGQGEGRGHTERVTGKGIENGLKDEGKQGRQDKGKVKNWKGVDKEMDKEE